MKKKNMEGRLNLKGHQLRFQPQKSLCSITLSCTNVIIYTTSCHSKPACFPCL